MDAFSVSIANGLENPTMKKTKVFLIPLVFAIFQAVMPMIGWTCVHFIAEKFAVFNKVVPYIALVLLSFIGGKMIFEAAREMKEKKSKKESNDITESELLVESDSVTRDGVIFVKEDTQKSQEKETAKKLGIIALLVQGVATSIDALSVGFTISEYNYIEAIASALIIAVVTYVICLVGVFIGQKIGRKFTGKAEIVGGIILIAIGLEIFIKSFF